MPRPRSPNRDKALQLWLESGKAKPLKDIAEELQVSEEQIRKWKNQDRWNKVTLLNGNGNVTKHKGDKTIKKEAIAEEVEQVMSNPDLTDKQRLFCLQYVRRFNATKAYQAAYGGSYEVAMVEGCNLLRNPKVKDEIHHLKQNRLNREFLDEADIFQKYMDIAFADITDFVEFGREEVQVMGAFGPVEVEDPDTGEKAPLTKMVNTVRFKESSAVDGTILTEVKQGKDGASIKLADRMKALDWIAGHMDLATDEQKARIDQIRAQTDKLSRESPAQEEDGVEIINDAPKETG